MATAGYRSKIDWDEAFTFYASRGPARTYVEVAARFEISEAAVRRRATRDDWRDRVETLDRQAAQVAERTVVRDRAERIADTIRLVDEARVRFERQFEDPHFALTASDFVALVKLEQLLEGKPTERHENSALEGLLGRIRLAVHGAELERALEAGDIDAAKRALGEAKQ